MIMTDSCRSMQKMPTWLLRSNWLNPIWWTPEPSLIRTVPERQGDYLATGYPESTEAQGVVAAVVSWDLDLESFKIQSESSLQIEFRSGLSENGVCHCCRRVWLIHSLITLHDIIAVKRSMDWIYPAEWFFIWEPTHWRAQRCLWWYIIIDIISSRPLFSQKKKTSFCRKKNCSKLVFRDDPGVSKPQCWTDLLVSDHSVSGGDV